MAAPKLGDVVDGYVYTGGDPGKQDSWKEVKTEKYKIGAEGLPDAIKEVAGGFSPVSKAAVGAAGFVNDMAMRAKQIFGGGLSPQDEQSVREYRALKEASPAATAGDIGMGLLATGGPGAALMRGATAGAKAIPYVPKMLAPTLAAGATGAGITAATTPTIEGESDLGNAGAGAAGSVAADLLLRGGARAVQPIMQSEPVKRLLSQGVVPTPGQAAGGMAGNIESKLESLPIVGNLIGGAKNRANTEFNLAALNRAAGTNEVGRAGLQQVDDALSRGYDFILPKISVRADETLRQQLDDIPNKAETLLPRALKDDFKNFIREKVLKPLGTGTVSGTLAKEIDSELGAAARSQSNSAVASERNLGQAFRDAQSAFRDAMERGAKETGNAEAYEGLKELNRRYANLLRVEKAAGSVGAKEGVFTPAQLQNAVRAMDPSKGKGQFARGEALMQDLGEDATKVLGQRVPNSGTTDRAAMLALLGLGGGGAVNEYYGGPGYLTALLASPLLYSRAGSRYMLGDYGFQQPVANLLRGSAPYAAQAGRLAATQ